MITFFGRTVPADSGACCRRGSRLRLAATIAAVWTTLVYASGAPPNTEQPLTLDAAVKRALELAPELGARTAALDAAEARATGAGRLPDPELIVGIDNLPVTGPDAYSTTQDFMTMGKVGVMQQFPRAGKRRLQRQFADVQASVAQAELAETRVEIARAVAQAWVWRASAEVSLNELRVLHPEIRLQAVAARAALAAGRGATAEALAAEGAVALLENQILKLQAEVRRASFELARWIDTDANRPLASMPSFDELPSAPGSLVADIHEHGELLPFQSQIEAARLAVDLARAEKRPDFSAELAFAKRGPEFSDMVSIQFRVGLPLFTKYRQEPAIAAKHAELRRLEAERDAAIRMHTSQLHQMATEWQLLGDQLQQYERELQPLARERSRASLASYRAGRGDLRLALEAYRQEVDLLIEHAELRKQRGRAWAYLRYLRPQHLPR